MCVGGVCVCIQPWWYVFTICLYVKRAIEFSFQTATKMKKKIFFFRFQSFQVTRVFFSFPLSFSCFRVLVLSFFLLSPPLQLVAAVIPHSTIFKHFFIFFFSLMMIWPRCFSKLIILVFLFFVVSLARPSSVMYPVCVCVFMCVCGNNFWLSSWWKWLWWWWLDRTTTTMTTMKLFSGFDFLVMCRANPKIKWWWW